MIDFTSVNDPGVARSLNDGLIGIIRTDTLYGVLARAANERAVNRVYDLKHRSEAKSPIVLISSIDDLFDVADDATRILLDSVWPGPVSVIVPSTQAPVWIRRDNNSVAYRMPADENLLKLLKQTGPLIAPSANPEGLAPAMDIDGAKNYFGEAADFYVDTGRVTDATPSQLLLIKPDGEVSRLR